jgi:hypothetical protein
MVAVARLRAGLESWARIAGLPPGAVRRLAMTLGATTGLLALGTLCAVAVTPKDPLFLATSRLPDGVLSGAALARLTASMDPSALRIAERFDPAAGRHDPPPAWAGLEAQEVSAPPVFKLQDISPARAIEVNDSIPFSSLPNPAARPFVLKADNLQNRAEAVQCLAAAVYYEAASQSDQGEAAVAQVVLNRLRNPLFPKTVCGVVFQGSQQSTGCQFTFTCDGSLNRTPDPEGWVRAKRIAERALEGYVEKSVGEATHYHANYVVPYWNTSLVKLTQISAHIFYRWNGSLGRPSAFGLDYAGSEGADWILASSKMAKLAGPVVIASDNRLEPQVAQVQAPALIAPQQLVASLDVQKTALPALATTSADQFQASLAREPRPRMLAVPSNW